MASSMSRLTLPPPTDGAPAIGVVVPTHNRAALLPRLVAALEAQDVDATFEVIVVDDGSSDDTWRVLADLADRTPVRLRCARLVHNAGPAAARNVGWQASTAALIAFTDDDCVPQPGWLDGLLQAAAAADVVQGRTLPDPAQLDRLGPFSRTLDISNEDGYYQTCNIAYRRTILEQLGGFHEEFRYPAGEDTDLAWRARDSGAVTSFAAAAIVHHDVRPSSLAVAIRDSWRWQSVALAASRHPRLREAFASRHIWRASHRAAISAAAGAATIAAARRSRVGWLVGAGLLAPYVHYRVVASPLPGAGPRRRWLLLPGAFAVDAAEVTACAVGSVRHRTLVL
jgi:glycosyltransferase involved in cell wall biosynthesis